MCGLRFRNRFARGFDVVRLCAQGRTHGIAGTVGGLMRFLDHLGFLAEFRSKYRCIFSRKPGCQHLELTCRAAAPGVDRFLQRRTQQERRNAADQKDVERKGPQNNPRQDRVSATSVC